MHSSPLEQETNNVKTSSRATYGTRVKSISTAQLRKCEEVSGVTVEHIDATSDKPLARIVSEARGGKGNCGKEIFQIR
jgi:hypothetical protein